MGKNIWLLALVVVVGVSGLAYNFYKADSMQKQLNALAVRDNILFEEVLEVEKTAPKTTFAEYLDKLVSNRRERDELKRKVEAVEPYKNEDQIARYVELLNSENEFLTLPTAKAGGFSLQPEQLAVASLTFCPRAFCLSVGPTAKILKPSFKMLQAAFSSR